MDYYDDLDMCIEYEKNKLKYLKAELLMARFGKLFGITGLGFSMAGLYDILNSTDSKNLSGIGSFLLICAFIYYKSQRKENFILEEQQSLTLNKKENN